MLLAKPLIFRGTILTAVEATYHRHSQVKVLALRFTHVCMWGEGKERDHGKEKSLKEEGGEKEMGYVGHGSR